jgi:hypothetical protein
MDVRINLTVGCDAIFKSMAICVWLENLDDGGAIYLQFGTHMIQWQQMLLQT